MKKNKTKETEETLKMIEELLKKILPELKIRVDVYHYHYYKTGNGTFYYPYL